jgi:hypothetical protein
MRNKISVVTIAKTEEEIERKIAEFDGQTVSPDEFCASTNPSLADAWPEAFSTVTGDVVVITETDARIVDEHFVEDLIGNSKPDTIVKGLESNHCWENFANVCCGAELLKRIPVTAEYSLGQDTEWYERCRRAGVKVRQIRGAAVIHDRGFATAKQLSRAYEYGRINVRLIREYGFCDMRKLFERHEMRKRIAEEHLRGMHDELNGR